MDACVSGCFDFFFCFKDSLSDHWCNTRFGLINFEIDPRSGLEDSAEDGVSRFLAIDGVEVPGETLANKEDEYLVWFFVPFVGL